MLDKKGQFSVFRMGMIAAGIGASLIIGAVVFFFFRPRRASSSLGSRAVH